MWQDTVNSSVTSTSFTRNGHKWTISWGKGPASPTNFKFSDDKGNSWSWGSPGDPDNSTWAWGSKNFGIKLCTDPDGTVVFSDNKTGTTYGNSEVRMGFFPDGHIQIYSDSTRFERPSSCNIAYQQNWCTSGNIKLYFYSGEFNKIWPKTEAWIMGAYDRLVTLDANGGKFADGSTQAANRIVDPTDILSTDNPPTLAGKRIVGWNTKADGTGDDVSTLGTNLKDNTTIYAQWGDEPGKPTDVMLDCGRRSSGGGVTCRVAVDYANAPSEYRDITTTSANVLAWSGKPIDGVRLDGNGYAINSACVSNDAQCYSVSLTDTPAAKPTNYVASTPQTGDPAAAWWQKASLLIAVLAIGIAAATVARTRKNTI